MPEKTLKLLHRSLPIVDRDKEFSPTECALDLMRASSPDMSPLRAETALRSATVKHSQAGDGLDTSDLSMAIDCGVHGDIGTLMDNVEEGKQMKKRQQNTFTP